MVADQPGERFAWTGSVGVKGIVDGHHMYELQPLAEGSTLLTQREEFTSWAVGLLWPMLRKAMGTMVTGVASPAKLDLVRSIGADRVIDYTRQDFPDGGEQYDLILDTGGNIPLRRLRNALTLRGTLVIVGGEGAGRVLGIGRQLPAVAWSPFLRQRLTMFLSREHHDDLDRLCVDLLRRASDDRPACASRSDRAPKPKSMPAGRSAPRWVRGSSCSAFAPCPGAIRSPASPTRARSRACSRARCRARGAMASRSDSPSWISIITPST